MLEDLHYKMPRNSNGSVSIQLRQENTQSLLFVPYYIEFELDPDDVVDIKVPEKVGTSEDDTFISLPHELMKTLGEIL